MHSILLILALHAAAQPPPFVVHWAEDKPVSGPLRTLGPDWSVTVGAVAVRGADLVSLRRADGKLPAYPEGPQVLLAGGDRLPGTVKAIARDRVAFRAELGEAQELSLPLEAVAVLWFESPAGGEQADLLRRKLLAERRTRDVVRLRNGDVIEGTVTSLDADFLRLTDAGKETKVERAKLAAVALNTDLARAFRPKGPYARLVLANGARLSLASAKADDRTLTGKALSGIAVQVPIDQIAALDLLQGRAEYLSDLKPASFEHTPFLGVSWPLVRDGSVAGRDLRLAGSTFDKGLGLHSASRVSYSLDGKYRRFEAILGLDDVTGKQGHVRVQVLVDGKPRDLGWNGDLSAADGARAVSIDVARAKELTLVVEFGRGGDVQDHVNWVDARLVR